MRDEHGILEGWRNNGYSDDMIAGGLARTNGHGIACPATAILPQRLPGTITVRRAWAPHIENSPILSNADMHTASRLVLRPSQ